MLRTVMAPMDFWDGSASIRFAASAGERETAGSAAEVQALDADRRYAIVARASEIEVQASCPVMIVP